MKAFAFFVGIGLVALPALLAVRSQSPVAAAPVHRRAGCASAEGLAKIVCLAEAFKATLTPEQVATVQLSYSKTDAAKWSNFPQAFSRPKRVGIGFGTLTPPQLAAAKALMAAVLAPGVPNEGYEELEGGLAADTYLGTATQQTATFGAGNYYLAFLGTPSLTGRWELQYGGHHYAFANTYQAGKTVGTTPIFRGVEPMSAVQANGRTYQPMEQERQAFAKLLGSLSPSEQAAARLSTTFHDMLLGPGQDDQFPATRLGLRIGTLSASKQQLVLRALKTYSDDLDAATAAAVLARYTAELPATYLAYVGSGTLSQGGDYVRLDGPRLWLEYSGQESRDFPGTVHPHSVWRDRLSDYGGK
jgi:hypothetical protein